MSGFYRFYIFWLELYTDHLYFHSLIVIFEFCYNLQKTM